VEFTCLTIDCHDPQTLAEFWNEALTYGGVTITYDGGGAVCVPADGGSYLEFVRVPEAKVVKNCLHLGCSAGSLDELRAEIERLSALGATIAWEEEFPAEVAARYRNVIMRDIEVAATMFRAMTVTTVGAMRPMFPPSM